jgi:hypothetical protein
MRLIVEVRFREIYIRYSPLVTRAISFTEISQVEAREYKPIREYGGWGIKGWSSKSAVYNVKGNEGVELTLVDGRKVMIVSQNPEPLTDAIKSTMRQVGLRLN